MSLWLHDIERLAIAVMLLLLLVMAPAMAQNVVYQGQTTTLAVVQVPGHNYEWELYNDENVNFATVQGNCPVSSANITGGKFGTSVMVQWKETGTYFFKVTARDAIGCTMNLKVGMVKVMGLKAEAVISGVTQAGSCQMVMFDGLKSTGGRLTYEWSSLDIGGELTLQTGVRTEFQLSQSFKGTLPADFRIKLTVTDLSGTSNSSITTITVDRLPVAAIVSNGKLEKDGCIIVDGTASTGTEINYLWSTNEGKILGPDNQITASLNGAGNYALKVTDIYGCRSTKAFAFPLSTNQVIAVDDYASTSWSKDITIDVLGNDWSSGRLDPRSVSVIQKPTRGGFTINPNGSIIYTPLNNRPGRDQFLYKVTDELSSSYDSATVTIDIYDSGVIGAEGFSPNGDGLNDLMVFKGLIPNYSGSQLYVYTRSGQLVYKSENYQNDWDGSTIKSTLSNKELVPGGVYYYILKLGGTSRSMKGFVYIGY